MIHNVKASDHLTFSGHVRPGTVDYSGFAINCTFIINVREWYVYTKNTSKNSCYKKLFFRGRHIKIRDRNGRYV